MRKNMIPPLQDFCGKLIFENPTVLRYFLSAVLKIPVDRLKRVKLIDPFLRRWFEKNKEGILDVLAELEDGRKINIEIQVEQVSYWDRRSLFYMAKLFIRGFHLGGKYKNLKSCVNISILDFDYLDTEEYHSVVRLYYGNGKLYSDAIELHVIELKKMAKWKAQFSNEHQYNQAENTLVIDEYEKEVQEWIEFFQCKTEREVMNLNAQTKNPGIKEAIKELLAVNVSEVFGAVYQAKLKQKRDKEAREDFVWNEGKIEGIQHGIEQGIQQGIQ